MSSGEWQVERRSTHVQFDALSTRTVMFPGFALPVRLRSLELANYADGSFGVWAEGIPMRDGSEVYSVSTRGWRVTAAGAPLGAGGHLSRSLLTIVDEIQPGWWPTSVVEAERPRKPSPATVDTHTVSGLDSFL